MIVDLLVFLSFGRVIDLLYFFIVLKVCFEIIIVRNKSCVCGGVCEVLNVIVVIWGGEKKVML